MRVSGNVSDGLVTNVQKGAVPTQAHSVARYVAKYVVSPPIAVRRIDRYDGERVTYHCRSHRTDRMEHETVTVDKVYWPDGAARDAQRLQAHPLLRRAGQTFAKVKGVIQAALAKVGVVKGAVKIIARLTYRQRYEQSTGAIPSAVPTVVQRWRCGESGTQPTE